MQTKTKSYEGSGADATNYLLDKTDSKGEVRGDIQVLRGDPKATAALIDCLTTRYRYTSTTIAWTLQDAPTDDEIQKVLDDWERVTFAGLRKSQYVLCAVLHVSQNGSKHLHIVVPRVNLEDARALNVAPPGHEFFFAKWRNVWNFDKGWARPDDPARARPLQPGVKVFESMSRDEEGMDQVPNSKAQIAESLQEEIKDGSVTDRAGVLKFLASYGEVTKMGRDYISVRLGAGAKPLRFKGLLFGESFTPELLRRAAEARAALPVGREPEQPEAAAAARVVLEAAVETRALYNKQRYCKPARAAERNTRETTRAAARQAVDLSAAVDKFRAQYMGPELALSHQPVPSRDTDVVKTGYVLNIINGDKDGLHKPGLGWPGSRLGAQSARGLSGLPRLPSLNLDANWARASVLLPAVARRNLEFGRKDSSHQVRRQDSSPGVDADQVQGVADHDDATRESVDRCIEDAQRAAQAAIQAVEQCIAGLRRAADAGEDSDRAIRRALKQTGSSARSARAADESGERAASAAIAADRGIDRALRSIAERVSWDFQEYAERIARNLLTKTVKERTAKTVSRPIPEQPKPQPAPVKLSVAQQRRQEEESAQDARNKEITRRAADKAAAEEKKRAALRPKEKSLPTPGDPKEREQGG